MTRIDLGQPIDICWFIERREPVICLKNKTNISLGYETWHLLTLMLIQTSMTDFLLSPLHIQCNCTENHYVLQNCTLKALKKESHTGLEWH